MTFTKLIPNIFYSDAQVGLALFVDCLGFKVVHNDLHGEHPFCIIKRDNLVIHLVQSHEFAIKDRPEIRLETDDIEAAYTMVVDKNAALLHPNLKGIKLQPWGLKEFALLDASGVCVIVQQP